MGKRLITDDNSLLECAFALSSEKAQTLESLSEALGASVEDVLIYWLMVNKLRRCQGRSLPVPLDASLVKGEHCSRYCTGGWYAPTWHLNKLLEKFQINEGLVSHYGQILTEPEGGHYELSLAASEIVLAVQLEHVTLDTAHMKRICVQACEPTTGLELLVSNAGKIILSVEDYRKQPFTPLFIEGIYEKLTEGISIKEVAEIEGQSVVDVDDVRTSNLESFCMHVWPHDQKGSTASPTTCEEEGADGENHTLINALVALHFLKTFRLLPAGNNVLAYLVYFFVLHRAGYHVSAHVPVMKLLYASPEGPGRESNPSCTLEELAVECNGYYDWTRFFEYVLEHLLCEQRWVMAKLKGIGRRRDRYRTIIDFDETLNSRQKEVLLEAALHSNAEFTYAIHVQRYDVSYPCARSDYARLLDLNFLRQHDDGIRHFFVASDTFKQVFLLYLQEHCAQAFNQFYLPGGLLRDEYKNSGDAVAQYNKDIGFYEKALLDKTYVEHYDFRRTPIADFDGPRSHKRPKGET